MRNNLAPVNVQNLFKSVSDVHSSNNRSTAADYFYIMQSRQETRKSSFFRFERRLWNNAPSVLKDLNKNSFKKKLHSMLIKILEKEDQYLEPELIVKQMSKF